MGFIQEFYCSHNKTRDGEYVINLDEHPDIGTHGIVLYTLNKSITYFDSLGVEHTLKEIKKFTGNENTKGSKITKNIFTIQAYDSLMRGYFCIGFINFMVKGKSLTDFKLFSPNNFKKKKKKKIMIWF